MVMQYFCKIVTLPAHAENCTSDVMATAEKSHKKIARNSIHFAASVCMQFSLTFFSGSELINDILEHSTGRSIH